MISPHQNTQRTIPFVCMLVMFGIAMIISASAPVSELSPTSAVLFWIVEAFILLTSLLIGQYLASWPSDSLWDYFRKTVWVAVLASLAAAPPSAVLDYYAGISSWGSLPSGPIAEVAWAFSIELVEEATLLVVPSVFLLTILNWLRFKGVFHLTNSSNTGAVSHVDQATPATLAPSKPPFWEKLERFRDGRLLALEAQQHYVLVHTNIGTELISYKFGCAVDDLSAWDGIQVHRSFWVARVGVETFQRKGRDVTIRLTSGIEVPISRQRKAEVMSALRH